MTTGRQPCVCKACGQLANVLALCRIYAELNVHWPHSSISYPCVKPQAEFTDA